MLNFEIPGPKITIRLLNLRIPGSKTLVRLLNLEIQGPKIPFRLHNLEIPICSILDYETHEYNIFNIKNI